MSGRRTGRTGGRQRARRSRTWWVLGVLTAALGGIVAASVSGPRAHGQEITVHKTATCGCCGQWVTHLEERGFRVTVNEVRDLRAVREALGIPPSLLSCHSAELEGYAVEGHVPAETLMRLLDERPRAAGVQTQRSRNSSGTSIVTGAAAPGAVHASRSRSIRGSVVSCVHTSTAPSSGPTIQDEARSRCPHHSVAPRTDSPP